MTAKQTSEIPTEPIRDISLCIEICKIDAFSPPQFLSIFSEHRLTNVILRIKTSRCLNWFFKKMKENNPSFRTGLEHGRNPPATAS